MKSVSHSEPKAVMNTNLKMWLCASVTVLRSAVTCRYP